MLQTENQFIAKLLPQCSKEWVEQFYSRYHVKEIFVGICSGRRPPVRFAQNLWSNETIIPFLTKAGCVKRQGEITVAICFGVIDRENELPAPPAYSANINRKHEDIEHGPIKQERQGAPIKQERQDRQVKKENKKPKVARAETPQVRHEAQPEDEHKPKSGLGHETKAVSISSHTIIMHICMLT